jgi:hypothetical protein
LASSAVAAAATAVAATATAAATTSAGAAALAKVLTRLGALDLDLRSTRRSTTNKRPG